MVRIVGLTLCLFIGLVHTVLAQRVDFDPYPQIDADIEHLDLTLEFDEGNTINGQATYTLTLLRDDIDELRLDAVRMDIEMVTWNGEDLDYQLDDDRLVISLPDQAESGRNHELGIQYRADPMFGVHHSRTGSIWSSGLPGSVRHWLPVTDHPRTRFSLDVSMVTPVDKRAVFSGVPGEEEAESVDLRRIRFYSDTEYPASALRFATGDFDDDERTLGRHRISLHAEEGVVSEEEHQQLLDTARELLDEAGSLFGSSYPSRSLQVVLLNDDKWEIKHYGAGTVFLYGNRGELHEQLAAGIVGQWVGVKKHEENWGMAASLALLQSWYTDRLIGSSPVEDRLYTVWEDHPDFSAESHYNHFTDRTWLAWSNWLDSEEQASLRRWLEERETGLLDDLPDVFSWQEFAMLAYESTGLSLFTPPQPELPELEEGEESLRFHVVLQFDSGAGEVALQYSLIEGEIDDPVTIRALERTGGGTTEHEVSFDEPEGEVVLSVDSAIENLVLQSERETIRLDQEKPFDFWFHQLRSEDEAERRAEAALGLKAHSDNPDLQLALLDLMRDESDPDAFAGMIRALAAVTDGSSGTSQLFLDRYSNDQDPSIQEAIMDALGNYSGNSTVISRLQSTILNGEHHDVRLQAIRSLSRVTDSEEFRGRAEALLTRERTLPVAEALLLEMVEVGEESSAIEQANSFLSTDYPWSVRDQMLLLLLELDRDRDRWLNRLDEYATDNDPRVRFRVLRGIEMLPGSDHEEILESRWYEEHDDRIRRLIETMQ